MPPRVRSHHLAFFRRLLSSTLLLCALPVLAVEVPRMDRLEHFTPRHGLSHRWVLELFQDRRGYLWVGTADGLSRYDGYEFEVYRHGMETSVSLTDDYVSALAEDPDGHLWAGTRSGLNRIDRLDGTVDRYRHDPGEAGTPSGVGINDLLVDREGTLWVATQGGLDRFDPATSTYERLIHQEGDPRTPSASGKIALLEDRRGALWLSSGPGTLERRDPETGEFEQHILFEDPDGTAFFRDLAEDRAGHFWLATNGRGLLRWNPETGQRSTFRAGGVEGLSHDLVYSLMIDGQGGIWAGTEVGLCLLDPATERFEVYLHDPDRPGTLSNDRVMALLEDETGGRWYGSDSGLNHWTPYQERFRHLQHHTGDPKGLSSDGVWPIRESASGHLWLGTIDRGLNRLDPESGEVRVYRHDPEDPGTLSSDTLTALLETSDGVLWVATDRGLDSLSREGVFERRLRRGEAGLPGGWTYAMVESRRGELWLAGSGGLSRIDRGEDRARTWAHDAEDTDSIGPGTLYAMIEDRDQDLFWLGSNTSGLMLFDPDRGQVVRRFPHDPETPGSLRQPSIASLFQDSAGTLWVGTQGGGLHRLRSETGTFEVYREEHGLPNDHILGIWEDPGREVLWLATNRGISRLDPKSEEVLNYDERDGLPSVSFFVAANTQTRAGEIFIGGAGGVLAFDPSQLVPDPRPPPVVVNEFLLFNQPAPWASREREPGSVGEPLHLVLTHRDQVFGFEFSAPHLSRPMKNRYAYRLEGFDREPIPTDADKRFAQYSNMPAGEYLFRVRASNPDGVWNEEGATVRLTVLPPPWKTWWAYTLYTLAVLGTVAFYVHKQRRKIAEERAINHRLRKVDRMKDEFLANTSHELKTPLYGIIGITESLIDGATGSLPESTHNSLRTVVASGRRLAKLVEDILDFSRLSHKGLELRRAPVDLRSLVEVVLSLNRPLVRGKELRLVNHVPKDLPWVLADEDRLQQIFHNLVGNAVKFTEQGRIEISALSAEGFVEVHVADSGIGIPESKIHVIFDSFEQVDATLERRHGGTGLGLAVTRQLVKMHGGSLRVESELGEGSTFIFSLPIAESQDQVPGPVEPRVEIFGPVEEPTVGEVAAVGGTEPGSGGHILVVDDEPVNRLVLVSHLRAEGFRLSEASEGVEALELLENDPSVDLVLLDIMMPKMSGFEVCRQIRLERSAHELPIIFLSAKNQPQDRISGFAHGANDYLAKPVAKNELLARVRTHLEILRIGRDLEEAVAERTAQIKVLGGLLPICGVCKKIRDDQGYWSQLETYVRQHSEATFSHGLCPSCAEGLYGELAVEALAEDPD